MLKLDIGSPPEEVDDFRFRATFPLVAAGGRVIGTCFDSISKRTFGFFGARKEVFTIMQSFNRLNTTCKIHATIDIDN